MAIKIDPFEFEIVEYQFKLFVELNFEGFP